MRPARTLAGLCPLATLALLADGDTRSQDKDKGKSGDAPGQAGGQGPAAQVLGPAGAVRSPAGRGPEGDGRVPEKTDKLREEFLRLDEEAARKRVALLTDGQRKKLIDLVAGPAPKAKTKDKWGRFATPTGLNCWVRTAPRVSASARC